MAQIDTLLQLASQHGASDLHIRVGSPPLMRVHGSLCPLPDDTHNANNPEVLPEILSEEHLHRFEKHHDLDFAYELPDVGRFRVNFLRQRQGIGAVFRVIPGRIPDLASLGLPQTVFELTRLEQGLVLVTGPTGSGKSTTLAAKWLLRSKVWYNGTLRRPSKRVGRFLPRFFLPHTVQALPWRPNQDTTEPLRPYENRVSPLDRPGSVVLSAVTSISQLECMTLANGL